MRTGRELFPTSDCLKAPQRENMIYSEILSHNADICCLQVRDQILYPIAYGGKTISYSRN